MTTPLSISIYCVWQWWESHYQAAHGRPDHIDFDWLDETYLGRQRQLHAWFGDIGIGEQSPTLDKDFVSKLLPYNTMIIPAILGMPVTFRDIGGHRNHPLSEEQLLNLKPVDLAHSRVGERLVADRAARIARYGRVTQMIDLDSPTNNAFSLRGTNFYGDLLADPPFARHYLQVITETMIAAYRFIGTLFGPLDSVSLGNCSVSMMSPELYVEVVRPYDVCFVEQAAASQGMLPKCNLHHCNVPAESFAEAYAAIPGLRSLQSSVRSDIRAICATLPDVNFSGMISPAELISRPHAELLTEIDQALDAGVHDLALWDVDPQITPEKLGDFLRELARLARGYGREGNFSFIPITWEELDWEFPRYHRAEEPFPAKHAK